MRHYHAPPQSTLVTDALLTGPAEHAQLLVVVLTSATNQQQSTSRRGKTLPNVGVITDTAQKKKRRREPERLLTCLCHCPRVW